VQAGTVGILVKRLSFPEEPSGESGAETGRGFNEATL